MLYEVYYRVSVATCDSAEYRHGCISILDDLPNIGIRTASSSNRELKEFTLTARMV